MALWNYRHFGAQEGLAPAVNQSRPRQPLKGSGSMSSIKGNRQKPIVPSIERHMYRYRLFQAIREYGKYQNDVNVDLRPLWKMALRELPHGDHVFAPFSTIRTIGRVAADRPAIAAYVDAVHHKGDVFHLRLDGKPAPWACEFIHVDVEPLRGSDGLVGPDERSEPHIPINPDKGPSEYFNAAYEFLTVMVNPACAEIYTGQFPDAAGDPEHIPAEEFMRFDEWDKLTESAHATLDHLIVHLRSTYESWYPEKPYPSTEARYVEDAKVVAKMLMNSTERSRRRTRAEVKRITRFTDLIRLDRPGQKFRKKLQK